MNLPQDVPAIATMQDVHLLLPASDVSDPEVTILIPALNEEITVGRFVEWCRQGIDACGACGRATASACIQQGTTGRRELDECVGLVAGGVGSRARGPGLRVAGHGSS